VGVNADLISFNSLGLSIRSLIAGESKLMRHPCGTPTPDPSPQGGGEKSRLHKSHSLGGALFTAYGFENNPIKPVAFFAWPSRALISSSRFRPGASAEGSRSVAIRVKV
jgi:hypothetical protein